MKPSNITISNKVFNFALLFFSAFFVFFVFIATKWGAWVLPDSISYIEAARNFLAGEGLSLQSSDGDFQLLSHYPPLYPFLLSIIGFLKIDPLDGSKILVLGVSALSLFAWGKSAEKILEGRVRALFFVLVLFLSPQWIEQHGMALSDPLFVLLCGFTVFILSKYSCKPSRRSLFFLALVVGACLLTRYAGGAVFCWVLLALCIRKTKLFTMALFAVVSLFPMVLWVFYSSSGSTTRAVSFHLPSAKKLASLLGTLGAWVFPHAQGLIAVSLGTAVLLTMLYFCIMHLTKSKSLPVYSFPIFYLLFILVSSSFLDAEIPFNERILFPVFPFFVLSLCTLDFKNLTFKKAAAPLAAIILFLYLTETYSTIKIRNAHGYGYSTQEWAGSEVVEHLRNLDSDLNFYTNAPDVVYLFTGKKARSTPAWANPATREPSPSYKAELQQMGERMRDDKYQLAYFNKVAWRWYLPNEEQLKQIFPLQLEFKAKDGALYSLKDQS